MNKAFANRFLKPITGLFIVTACLTFAFAAWLDENNINHTVLMNANIILFILALFAGYIQVKALHNNNPHAFVRSIMIVSFLKLIVIAAGVLIYFAFAGESRSIYAVFASMILYIFYTILEVNGATKMNRRKNAKS